jgi:membrane associated rhomboid family serine protease
MSQPSDGPPATGVPTCYRHPGREAHIRCQRCDRTICPDCMNTAAVGFQCPECVREGSKGSRQNAALYGGERSADPRLTTFVLIGINAVVWLLITATGGARSRLADLFALAPTGTCASASSPGQYYPGVPNEAVCDSITRADGVWHLGVADGAWWQLVTTAFTHIEIWHVAMNMLALYFFGPVLEQIVGRARFLGIFAVSTLASSVMVLWFSSEQGSTVGASGAIFGLLGALLVVARKARLNSQALLQNLGLGVVITVVGWQSISWQGHLGGLIGGAVAAAVVAYAPKAHRSAVQWTGLGVALAVLVVLAVVRAGALA